MSDLDESAVKKLKVPELRSELTKRGLDTKGLKQILVDRLLAALVDDDSIEMATEEKEIPDEEDQDATKEAEVVAENGEPEKGAETDDVSSEMPSELLTEDTSATDQTQSKQETNAESGKDEAETKEEAMESDAKDNQEATDEKSGEAEEENKEGDDKNDDAVAAGSEDAQLTMEDEEDKTETYIVKDDINSEKVPVIEEEKDETDDSSVVFSRYISDLYFKVSPDGLTGSVIDAEGFSYIWGGAKTTWGAKTGKLCFECKVLKNVPHNLPDSEEPKNAVRVGWSAQEASVQLGEDNLSYGYESSGKSCTASNFSDYGVTFTEGDVIGSYLDLDSEEKTISFTKNGEDLDVAFTLSEEDVTDKVYFPHVILKNTECQINTGAQDEPWFPCKEGFTLIEKVGNDNLVEGDRGNKERGDCEVIMMVGLPASGKTTWVNNHVAEGKEKRYNVIGTNSIMEKMKINGEERKRSSEDFDKLMDKATKCLKKLFELAPTKRRNYILDQTNVHPTAQRRKMEPFSGFKHTAVVLVTKTEELEKRAKEKKEKDGFEIPDYALSDMKANFMLPRVGSLFNEITFVEENQEESEKIIKEYQRNARSSHSRVPTSYNRPRRDDNKGRYHPYKRDDHRSHSGGGGRDFRHQSGGRGGGGSNYGRQHGGGSYDRSPNRGGYNKSYQYSSYSRGGGGRGGSGGYYKGGQQQQQYGSYGASRPYMFGQQAYGFQGQYQPQQRSPYGGFSQQQQQQYYAAQQNYYQQQGYNQQYGRRY